MLGSATAQVASHQVSQAIKLIVGDVDAVDRALRLFDLWRNEHRAMDTSAAAYPECECCVHARFDFLDADPAPARMLCGRNAVQIRSVVARSSFDLDRIEERLAAHGVFERGSASIQGVLDEERSPTGHPVTVLVFEDGRAIVEGATDVD